MMGEAGVGEYRLLLLNAAGRAYATAVIVCSDDVEAMTEAQELLRWHAGVEVWQGERIVGRLRGGID